MGPRPVFFTFCEHIPWEQNVIIPTKNILSINRSYHLLAPVVFNAEHEMEAALEVLGSCHACVAK
jgi:hypothetical protein